MPRKKIKFNKFEIPETFLEQLYEFTGSLNKNKGYIIVYIDEEGNGQLKQRYDSQATEFALSKFLELFVNENVHHIDYGNEETEDEDEEDEDDD
jgi:hypothetical protein